jgi:hypothetical protein
MSTKYVYSIGFMTPEAFYARVDFTRNQPIRTEQDVLDVENALREHLRRHLTVIAFSLYSTEEQA